MLPILATVGSGLSWFAVTAAQIAFWGFGIGIGFWLSKKLTDKVDQKMCNFTAEKLWKRGSKAVATA